MVVRTALEDHRPAPTAAGRRGRPAATRCSGAGRGSMPFIQIRVVAGRPVGALRVSFLSRGTIISCGVDDTRVLCMRNRGEENAAITESVHQGGGRGEFRVRLLRPGDARQPALLERLGQRRGRRGVALLHGQRGEVLGEQWRIQARAERHPGRRVACTRRPALALQVLHLLALTTVKTHRKFFKKSKQNTTSCGTSFAACFKASSFTVPPKRVVLRVEISQNPRSIARCSRLTFIFEPNGVLILQPKMNSVGKHDWNSTRHLIKLSSTTRPETEVAPSVSTRRSMPLFELLVSWADFGWETSLTLSIWTWNTLLFNFR